MAAHSANLLEITKVYIYDEWINGMWTVPQWRFFCLIKVGQHSKGSSLNMKMQAIMEEKSEESEA